MRRVKIFSNSSPPFVHKAIRWDQLHTLSSIFHCCGQSGGDIPSHLTLSHHIPSHCISSIPPILLVPVAIHSEPRSQCHVSAPKGASVNRIASPFMLSFAVSECPVVWNGYQHLCHVVAQIKRRGFSGEIVE